jgi:hypothetical protein
MSNQTERQKHSKRIDKQESAIKRQVKIAKVHGQPVPEPHRLAKHHAMDCGRPGCMLCGNPRKIFKELTIQERRFDQPRVDN